MDTDTFVALMDAFKLTKEVFELVPGKGKALKQLFSKRFYRSRKIYIFGNSGSGKTVFLENLSCRVTDKYFKPDTPAYISSRSGEMEVNRSEIVINSKNIEMYDVTGHKEAGSFDKVMHDIKKEKIINGIIFVVSYGYDWKERLRPKKILESDLSEKRNEEIKIIQRIIADVGNNNIGWIILLVKKADLWHERATEVYDYYEKNVIERIDMRKTTLMPYCSVMRQQA